MLDTTRTELGSRQSNCKAHGAFESTGMRLDIGRTSRELWSTCRACAEEAASQAALATQERAANLKRDQIAGFLKQSAIPKRFIGKLFDNYHADTPQQQKALSLCQRYANNFERSLASGHGLVLAGNPGAGKTHLACAILQTIMPAHIGAYITVMDLIRLLRASWGGRGGGSELDALEKLGELPLLVIDELGVQFGSDGERVHLHDVLDRRYREQRPTILLTNEDDAGLLAIVGERVYDRLTETATTINFLWKSHRLEARKENA